jgi:tetratricopeptide (TPR) repeat protein
MMELDSRIPAPPPTPIVEEIAIPVLQEPVAVIEEPMAVVEPEQPVEVVPELVATETAEQEGAGEVTEDAQRTGNKIAEEQLIYPIYTEDYFLHQGMPASPDIPDEIGELIQDEMTEEEKSLMVVMSFTEWLLHFKKTGQKQKEEKKDQKALKTMWQKEKLAAAMEEENEEIPENVFEMAVNSITKEDGLASESLADIYIKQGKYDKAIEMYRKLSLRKPKKNVYFARKIEEILKEKQS